MTRFVCVLIGFIAAVAWQPVLAQAPQSGAAATQSEVKPRRLTINNKAWTGDFDKMLERRVIRVYAPFPARFISMTTDARGELRWSWCAIGSGT